MLSLYIPLALYIGKMLAGIVRLMTSGSVILVAVLHYGKLWVFNPLFLLLLVLNCSFSGLSDCGLMCDRSKCRSVQQLCHHPMSFLERRFLTQLPYQMPSRSSVYLLPLTYTSIDCVQLPTVVSQFPWYSVSILLVVAIALSVVGAYRSPINRLNPDWDTVMIKDLEIERLFQELLKFQEQDSSYNLSQFRSLITLSISSLWNYWKYISQGSEVFDWGAEMDIFLFPDQFDTKPLDFRSMTFPFARSLNGYEFNKRSCEEPRFTISRQKIWCSCICGVLEHVRKQEAVRLVTEIFRILKLNGYLSVTTFPNQFSLIEFIASFVQ